jgi:hypothetical protein
LHFFCKQNEWGQIIPPADFGILRNLPLMIVGITVAILLLKNGIKEDKIVIKILAIALLFHFHFMPQLFSLLEKFQY